MKHKTPFELMNPTQRSLHNLIYIIDDDILATYIPAISYAIDEITRYRQLQNEYVGILLVNNINKGDT